MGVTLIELNILLLKVRTDLCEVLNFVFKIKFVTQQDI